MIIHFRTSNRTAIACVSLPHERTLLRLFSVLMVYKNKTGHYQIRKNHSLMNIKETFYYYRKCCRKCIRLIDAAQKDSGGF